jgi:ArsR family transcriptional regulator
MSSFSDASGGKGADLAFDALADPTRRQILAVLAQLEECSAGTLAEHITNVGRTAVSTHLRVLRVADLVVERREGRHRYYSVNSKGSVTDVMTLLVGLFKSSLGDARSAVEADQPGSSLSAEAG